MKTNGKLWSVPLYCILASIVTDILIQVGLWRFSVKTLADGSTTNNAAGEMVVFGVIFVVALLVGWLLFRKMAKRRIFQSATVMVALLLAVLLLQWLFRNSYSPFLNYLSMISDWSGFVPLALTNLTQSAWIGAIVNCFVPYIFVLFGRRRKTE